MVVEHQKRHQALLAFQPILDALPLPATLLDRDGHIQGWNRAAELTFGWAAGDVISHPAPGIPEDEQDAFIEQLQRALRGESVLGLEGRRLTKDGSIRRVRLAAGPLYGPHGEIVGALRTFEDVTEHAEAEGALREVLAREQQARLDAEEAQQRLTFLADASAMLASSLDYETTLTNLAQLAVERIADWCAIHLVDDNGEARQITIVHPDPARLQLAHELERRLPYDPNADSGVPEVLRTGVPELIPELTDEMLNAAQLEDDVRAMLRELGLRSWIVAPLTARGHVLGAITFVAAESDRRYGPEDLALALELAGRAALAVDNARLYSEAQRIAAEQSAILAQMADGVAIANAAGRIIFVNDAGRKLSGNHAPDIALDEALTLYQVTTDEGQPFTPERTPLFRALRQRETISDAYWRLHRADGTEIIVQGNAAPLLGMNGELLGAVSTYRDVTAQRLLEQQRDQFLAAAAHDLKTPLTTIRGVAQILRRRLARGTVDPPQFTDGLSRIEQTTTRMTSLINELLDLARLQVGQSLDLNRRPSDLVALVTRAVSEQEEMAGDRHIRVEAAVSELVGVWDFDRLDRVVSNLLSNAIKYSPDGSEITITIDRVADQSEPWAVLSVRDHGIGIPAGDLPHIFQRFHRGQNVGNVIGGTGIGLAACKQIVEQHQGTITVKSQEGVGSTFTVRLPIQEPAQA